MIGLVLLSFFWAIGPAEAMRIHTNLKTKVDDVIDLSPLFQQRSVTPSDAAQTASPHDDDEVSSVYHSPVTKSRLRCCCKNGVCSIGDLSIENTCDKDQGLGGWINTMRDRDRCGCVMGMGFQSFDTEPGGACLMSATDANRALAMGSAEEVRAEVARASKQRFMQGFEITYGECSSSCGHGMRSVISTVDDTEKRTERLADFPDGDDRVKRSIACKETSGCAWNCAHGEDRPCGWGAVTCLDKDGRQGYLCDSKGTLEPNFLRQSVVEEQCFKTCPAGQGLTSVCAITSNHLDEQYGSLANLIEKTCQSDSQGEKGSAPLHSPDMIVLLTQELNHASRISIPGMESDDFPEFVHAEALEGYVMAATCVGKLSANTAVFVKSEKQHQIWADNVECTGTSLRSEPCDFTNCKGSTVMGLTTSAGKLVVANWHGQRAGTISHKRVEEFENAASAILEIQPFQGKKFVVMGGDTNVRSDFGPKDDYTFRENLDLAAVNTPAQILSAIGPDVLGFEDWTVDQHLSGVKGFSESVKLGLQNTPLKQVKGWNTICPGKTKTLVDARFKTEDVWTGEYKESRWWGKSKVYEPVTEKLHNLMCESPAEQMSTGTASKELIDMKKIWGDKSSSPSWTERFFLDETLYENCGKAMKDIRNPQTDHDPLYVRCTLPDLL